MGGGVLRREALLGHGKPGCDDCGGAGLSSAPSYGLPHGAAPAHVGVLGEGEEPEAQILPDRQHPGQAAPQRRHTQSGHQHILRGSDADRGDVAWPPHEEPGQQSE